MTGATELQIRQRSKNVTVIDWRVNNKRARPTRQPDSAETFGKSSNELSFSAPDDVHSVLSEHKLKCGDEFILTRVENGKEKIEQAPSVDYGERNYIVPETK